MHRSSRFESAGQLNPNLAPSPLLRGRDAFRWLAFLGVLVCFWLILEHRFTASIYYSEESLLEFDGTENHTADRIGVVNRGSSIARIALAVIGLTALLTPSQFRFRWQSPVVWSMAAYFGWLFCTAFWSINLGITIYKLIVVALFSSAAIGISRHLTMIELIRMLSGACLVMMLIGVGAEIGLGTFNPLGNYRFSGTTHPNTEATYAAIVCLSAWTYTGEGSERRWLSIVAFAFAFLVLMLTKSRTSLAAVLVALVALQTLRLRGGKRLMFVAAMILAAGLGLTTMSMVGKQFQNRLSSAAAMGRTEDLGNLTGRLPLWEELMTEVAKSPVFGRGYLAYWDAERIEYLSDLFNWEIPHGHNMYLDVTLDAGLVGLSLFVAMYLTGLLSSASYFLRTGEPGASVLFGLLVFAMIHGCTESLLKMFGFSSFVLMSLLLRLAWVNPARRDGPRVIPWISDFPRTKPLPTLSPRSAGGQL
jgi:exopolysaccharide production protein ExoQ